jgi:hypothetical protein
MVIIRAALSAGSEAPVAKRLDLIQRTPLRLGTPKYTVA